MTLVMITMPTIYLKIHNHIHTNHSPSWPCNLTFFHFWKHLGRGVPDKPWRIWTRGQEIHKANCRAVTGWHGKGEGGRLLFPQSHITCSVIEYSDILNVLFLSLSFILKKLVDSVPQFVPRHLLCPLSKKMFVDPVKTVYGTVYERKAIEEHIKKWVNLLLMRLPLLVLYKNIVESLIALDLFRTACT